jgi:hypothetical protein
MIRSLGESRSAARWSTRGDFPHLAAFGSEGLLDDEHEEHVLETVLD